jgi:hypothetical protein
MNKKKLIELRCKAWGITEDEYYCNQCSDFSLEDMARAYRRGKNKGARDKAIQNVGFYQKQMQDIYDKKNKQIAELKEKNKALDKDLFEAEKCIHWLGVKDEQLTKAKEIIKKLYSHVFQGMDFMELNDYNVQKAETEQFLKDSEVEK